MIRLQGFHVGETLSGSGAPRLEIRLQSVTEGNDCYEAHSAGLVSMWSRFHTGAVHLRQAFLERHTIERQNGAKLYRYVKKSVSQLKAADVISSKSS